MLRIAVGFALYWFSGLRASSGGRVVVCALLALWVLGRSASSQSLVFNQDAAVELYSQNFSNTYPFLTPDGLRVYFVKASTLYTSVRANRQSTTNFGVSTVVGGLNAYVPTGCWLTEDQLTIYFATNTAVYRATRTTALDAFGTPQTVSLPASVAANLSAPSLSPDLSELYLCIGSNTLADRIIRLRRVGTTLAYAEPDTIKPFIAQDRFASAGQLSKDGLSFYIGLASSANASKQLYRFARHSLSGEWDSGTLIAWESASGAVPIMCPSVSADQRYFACNDNSTTRLLYTAAIKSSTPPTIASMPDTTEALRPVFRWNRVDGATYYSLGIIDALGSIYTSVTDTFYVMYRDVGFGRITWQVSSDNSGTAFDTITVRDARIPRIIAYEPKLTQQKRPTMRWRSVAGAGEYRVDLYDVESSRFWYSYQLCTDTAFTPTTDLPCSRFFWRVSSNLVGTFSARDTFAIVNGTVPSLVRFDGAGDTTHRPRLVWNTVSAFSDYTVKASLQPDFGIEAFRAVVKDTSFVPTSNLVHRTVYWTVAYNPVGEFAAADSLVVLSALPPQMVQPWSNQHGVETSSAFLWERISSASGYRLEVSKNPGFSSPVLSVPSIADSTYSGAGLDYTTRYYWRVAAMVQGDLGGWARDSFVTKLPPGPEVVYPDGDATGLPGAFSMCWHPVAPGATYAITLGLNEHGYSDFVDTTVADTFLAVSALKGGRYYFWNITTVYKGIYCDGTRGRFMTRLRAPRQIYPPSGAVGVWHPLTLTWESSPVGVFSLQLDTARSFASPIIANPYVVDSTYLLSQYSSFFTDYTRYYWRVQIKTTDSLGPWALDSFTTTGSQGEITPLSPVNGATVFADSILFQWLSNVSYNGLFELVIATDTSLNDTFVIYDTTLVDVVAVVKGLDPGRRYWWGVRAVNSLNGGWFGSSFQLNTQGSAVMLPRAFGCKIRSGLSASGATVRYALATEADVAIQLLDMHGRLVRSIVAAHQPAGYYEVPIDRAALGAGCFLLDFRAGPHKEKARVLLR